MKPLLAATLALALTLVPVAARAQSSPEQRAAATELLVAMHAAETLQNAIETSVQAQVRTNPQLQPVADVMREFIARYAGWEALREQFVELYARRFTEDELRQMTDFYRSDVGQKLARATPGLMREGAALGERAVQQHQAELQQMVMARLRKVQQTAPPPKP